MGRVPMSEKRSIEPTPLGRFLEQYSKDLEAKVSRGLLEYLQLFPGDPEHIAEEYLALKRFREQVDEAPQSAIPAQISHYRIVKEIGRGGQGVVYLAKDLKLGREVAIKMLRRSRLAIDELERLQREARIASRLDHPGICPIYEIGDYGGEPYVVMRYVRGTPLSQRISHNKKTSATTFTFVDVSDADLAALEAEAASTPPKHERKGQGTPTPSGADLQAVVRLIEQVARSLHEAHEAKIVHRDVKPGNIIVTPEGQPVLLDFGVATMAQEVALTRTGETPGTPPYMSPEQAYGKHLPLDRRSDVYSLGVTLYECLTLKLPFSDTSDYARQIMFVPPPDPRSINPAIPKDLKIILDTALEKDRERRYQTAADFADDLRRFRDHEPLVARPVGFGVKLLRWVQRNPAIATAIISIIAILTAALIVVWGAFRETDHARELEKRSLDDLNQARSLYEPLADLKRVQDLRLWSGNLWPGLPSQIGGPDGMEEWIKEAEALAAKIEGHEAALRAFEQGDQHGLESGQLRRRIKVLRDLIPELGNAQMAIGDMQRRLASAKTIEARTVVAPKERWDEVAAELEADPRFASIGRLKPQIGLVPIGKNDQGYFEFAVVSTGPVPSRRSKIGPPPADVSATLILLPGGKLTFDPGPDTVKKKAAPSEMISTEVGPHFLGKYEVSQAQWTELMGLNPSGSSAEGDPEHVYARHPVENVSWNDCAEFCKRAGASLPTQDEWELGARSKAGLEFGDCDEIECVEGKENLCDLSYIALRKREPAGFMNWNDGYPFHGPVGSFAPNAFGLHDMLGNVSEWCSDPFYGVRRPSDVAASRPNPGDPRRVFRGANYFEAAREASCRYFRSRDPDGKMPQLGLRIARSIDR